jgi:signal transduction histidine kinase
LIFLLNRFVLRKLWRPFYNTIEELKTFELERSQTLHLPSVKTEEFALLNATLTGVSERAVREYTLLKEFTENASHELQTPLAVIGSKLDLLIQDEALSGSQSKIVQDAYHALARMTHLNQSLLELAKIEGGQYHKRLYLDLRSLLSEKLSVLEELFHSRALQVSIDLESSTVRMHPVLADMLLNNLLTNAIYHNVDNGQISIRLGARSLTICNTSEQPPISRDLVFRRFSKPDNQSRGTGLGLAISQQICAASACTLDYHHKSNRHCFTVRWDENAVK